jgi:predicted DNA-binding antitoxin AbrB/MazE fold protein
MEVYMTAVKAIYDGKVFIPEKPCNILSGSEVTLNIIPLSEENTSFSVLSKEEALEMTSEIINKYRPALEELA